MADTRALNSALHCLLKHKIIGKCLNTNHLGFFSNVFPVIKADGIARVILNLSVFNDHIIHVHFEMESIFYVI